MVRHAPPTGSNSVRPTVRPVEALVRQAPPVTVNPRRVDAPSDNNRRFGENGRQQQPQQLPSERPSPADLGNPYPRVRPDRPPVVRNNNVNPPPQPAPQVERARPIDRPAQQIDRPRPAREERPAAMPAREERPRVERPAPSPERVQERREQRQEQKHESKPEPKSDDKKGKDR